MYYKRVQRPREAEPAAGCGSLPDIESFRAAQLTENIEALGDFPGNTVYSLSVPDLCKVLGEKLRICRAGRQLAA